jgi:hypothetical protein
VISFKESEVSYDLYFWRQSRGLRGAPVEIYNRLVEDEDVKGVEHLKIDTVRAQFQRAFPDIEDEGAQLVWQDFIVSWSIPMRIGETQLIVVNCSWSLTKQPDTLNRIIDAGAKCGCALYDPQTDTRFAQPP